jgi:hypothetical protein
VIPPNPNKQRPDAHPLPTGTTPPAAVALFGFMVLAFRLRALIWICKGLVLCALGFRKCKQ